MAATNLEIMVNNVNYCNSYGADDHKHATGTCNALVELSAGDLVNVKLVDPQGDGGVVYGGRYSIFTGFLYQAL